MSTTQSRRARVAVPLAAVLDLVALIVFVAIGRSSHDEAFSPAGFANTLWPFLTGAAIGWAVSYIISRDHDFEPGRLVPAGVIVWPSTVVIGMILRVISGQGTAVSFCVVASIATGVFLLSWRAVAALVLRGR
ncbi:MAG: DUF3054 domain-containing protein [Gordonia sp. (in: high G+C Gram-positive bacteria)]